MGHLIRCEDNDPMKRPALTQNLERNQQAYKRVGRPRDHWIDTTLRNISLLKMGRQYNGSDEHKQDIIDLAVNRRI